MRLVVLTATLVTTLWLGIPHQAAAQEAESIPASAAEPAPRTPVERNVAVPRSRQVVVRDAEVRARDTQAPENRAHSSPSLKLRRTAVALAEAGRRAGRAPVRQPEPARSFNTVSADDEQRRGAVRRPPSSDSGRARPSGRGSSDSGRASDDSGRGSSDSRRGGNSGVAVDRAVPRSSVPTRQPERVYVYPDYYRNYNRYYDPWGYGAFGLGYFYYSPWAWNPGYYGHSGYGYGSQGYYPRGLDTGSVKLKVTPRDAEVYVDGYFAGHVDDFDGIFQALKLDSGAYRIEVRKPGFETLHFDVRVQSERSITFRGEMRAAP